MTAKNTSQAAARRSARGFTLLEVLIVVGVMGLLATFAIPELLSVIRRSKIEGAAQTMTRLMNDARAEAIYRGSPVFVHPDARLNGDGDEVHYLVAWVDVNENGEFDGTITAAGQYLADPLEPERTVDYPLFEWQLPFKSGQRTESNVYFWAAADTDPSVRTYTVDGLTDRPAGVTNGYGDWDKAVVFLDNGSVPDDGGLRFGMGPFGGTNTEVNYLELRIAPRASGRIELRKFIPPPVGSYQPKGHDDNPQGGLRYEWEWY